MFEDLQQILSHQDEVAILDLIRNEQYIDEIKNNPWEVIPNIVQHINGITKKEYPSFYKSLLTTFDIISKKIDPDDIILILVREIEDVKEDSTFIVLLEVIEKALLKLLPKNKINYLAWSLNSIQIYLNQLPPPENLNLEDNERLLMDADATVTRISMLYYDMLTFYDSITPIILSFNYENHKILLLRNILQLFGHPLLYLDMEVKNKTKSKARLIAENLVYKVLDLCPDTYSFLEDNFCSYHEDIKVKPISLSVFYYLHLSEFVGLEKSLKVYDPIFVFQNTLKFVIKLLIVEHQFVIEKGLKLVSSLLQITSSFTLPYGLLDNDVHCKFCKSLTNIIIYNSVEAYRKDGLKIFNKYLYKFDSRGRYLLIYNIIKYINNISLTSYLITQYKQMLLEQLDKSDSVNYYFRESKLATLLGIFCSLSEGVETDLMKSADQIIASLNLLRYLVLRDKSNATGIWNYIKSLQKSFLDPLKEALILSKAHYNLKLKEISDENAHGDKFDNNSKVSVSIAGQYLPDLTPTEKINVINSSITAFDVIDSLLSRLNECIEYDHHRVKE